MDQAPQKENEIQHSALDAAQKTFQSTPGIEGMISAGLIEETKTNEGETIFLYKPYSVPDVTGYNHTTTVMSLPIEQPLTSSNISVGTDDEILGNFYQETFVYEYAVSSVPQTSGYTSINSEDTLYNLAMAGATSAGEDELSKPVRFKGVNVTADQLHAIFLTGTAITFGAVGLLYLDGRKPSASPQGT